MKEKSVFLGVFFAAPIQSGGGSSTSAWSTNGSIDFQKLMEAIPGFRFVDKTPAAIFSSLLPIVYLLAGLLLGLYLIIGGFELLTSGGSEDGIAAAKSKITNAVVGFLLVFLSYWLIQILQVIFGIQIL